MSPGTHHLRALDQALPSNQAENQRLRRACQEFDAFFLSYLLKLMRETIPKSGLLTGGVGEDIFTHIIDQNLALDLAKGEGLGLSSLLWQNLSPEALPGVPEKESPPLWSQAILLNAYKKAAPPEIPSGVLERLNRYDHLIRKGASTNGLNPNLIRAVIVQESGGEPKAQSPKGAKGLMQLLDGTSRDLGVNDPFNPEENIRGGCNYLRMLLRRFNGELKLALAAYNAGPEAVGRYGSLPPIRETREYVQAVLNYKTTFDQIYPSP